MADHRHRKVRLYLILAVRVLHVVEMLIQVLILDRPWLSVSLLPELSNFERRISNQRSVVSVSSSIVHVSIHLYI